MITENQDVVFFFMKKLYIFSVICFQDVDPYNKPRATHLKTCLKQFCEKLRLLFATSWPNSPDNIDYTDNIETDYNNVQISVFLKNIYIIINCTM